MSDRCIVKSIPWSVHDSFLPTCSLPSKHEDSKCVHNESVRNHVRVEFSYLRANYFWKLVSSQQYILVNPIPIDASCNADEEKARKDVRVKDDEDKENDVVGIPLSYVQCRSFEELISFSLRQF
jgi:hypothetical protein